MNEPKESSSPACLAHEADDAYMGFATRAEIAAFLKDIDQMDADSIRKMLPRIRDDVLHKEISLRLAAIEAVKSGI
ncbi:MAG: hypothetical protein EPO55_06050 [Reyranella sp.]|uniref:hypothetical protein n=1 Tax=Reyranella sp. TaxID=1929291 RepID=UPI00120A1B9F|nr:hypothetical protein [Reyranella sp.]TAJ41310.1 MAG: hypothetical protein EPO55_06050 [Reyranella sp.]